MTDHAFCDEINPSDAVRAADWAWRSRRRGETWRNRNYPAPHDIEPVGQDEAQHAAAQEAEQSLRGRFVSTVAQSGVAEAGKARGRRQMQVWGCGAVVAARCDRGDV